MRLIKNTFGSTPLYFTKFGEQGQAFYTKQPEDALDLESFSFICNEFTSESRVKRMIAAFNGEAFSASHVIVEI